MVIWNMVICFNVSSGQNLRLPLMDNSAVAHFLCVSPSVWCVCVCVCACVCDMTGLQMHMLCCCSSSWVY
jgi:hypothetical protein